MLFLPEQPEPHCLQIEQMHDASSKTQGTARHMPVPAACAAMLPANAGLTAPHAHSLTATSAAVGSSCHAGRAAPRAAARETALVCAPATPRLHARARRPPSSRGCCAGRAAPHALAVETAHALGPAPLPPHPCGCHRGWGCRAGAAAAAALRRQAAPAPRPRDGQPGPRWQSRPSLTTGGRPRRARAARAWRASWPCAPSLPPRAPPERRHVLQGDSGVQDRRVRAS